MRHLHRRGYVYAAAGELLHGTGRRHDLKIDGPGLIGALMVQARAAVAGDLLRLNWFDAARDRVRTVEQRELARVPYVKVPLGNLNRVGVQKGVDAQLREELAALADAGAITDAVLLSGDEDMVPGVEAAQVKGVRVHLWGVEPPYGSNQSERLVWEADTVSQLDRAFLEPFVERTRAGVAAVTADGSKPASLNSSGQDAELPVAAVPAPTPATPATIARNSRLPVPGAPPPGPAGPSQDQMIELGEHVASRWLVTRGRATWRTCFQDRPCRNPSTSNSSSRPNGRWEHRCARFPRPKVGCAKGSGHGCTVNSGSLLAEPPPRAWTSHRSETS